MSRPGRGEASRVSLRSVCTGVLALGALALGACSDDGPDGPGPLSATISGPTMGAAIVEVTGSGITGFEGAGSAHVVDASTAPGVYRVIVVGETPGSLSFDILVEDRSAALPTGFVISAVDGSNLPFATTTGISLQVAR